MKHSHSWIAVFVLGWLAAACIAPGPTPGAPPEGAIAWVGYGGEVMDAGWLPDDRHTVVSGTPDEPGEVTMVMLAGPTGSGELPPLFPAIPSFPEDGETAGEAAAELSSRGLGVQFYELKGDSLYEVETALVPTDAPVVGNHPSSVEGTNVAPGTIVGVVVLIRRAEPE